MAYTFELTIQFKDVTSTLPYRSTRYWKTVKGALRAAECHSEGLNLYYDNVAYHSLVILDQCGQFVTNEAA